MGAYDDALAKAIAGEGSEGLDSVVRGSSYGAIGTCNSGNQNAPDISKPEIGKGEGNGGQQQDCQVDALLEALVPGHAVVTIEEV